MVVVSGYVVQSLRLHLLDVSIWVSVNFSTQRFLLFLPLHLDVVAFVLGSRIGLQPGVLRFNGPGLLNRMHVQSQAQRKGCRYGTDVLVPPFRWIQYRRC